MSSQSNSLHLPALREDLQLLEGGSRHDGSPYWMLFDPLRNRYFRIGWHAFQLLSRWNSGTAENLLNRVHQESTATAQQTDIEEMVRFLYANSLTRQPANGDYHSYLEQVQASKQNWLKWLIHNYLFFRVPLVRPNAFLKRTYRYISFVYTQPFMWLIVLLGLVGTHLAIRQWETFLATFLYFFSWEGLAGYGITLVAIKIAHELGHAYTATRYGLKVPTMGVAFLVMFPVLYTDATDSWRLKRRRYRMNIAAAGMTTELSIALVATFMWSLFPEGILRSIAFFAATTSWVTTIAVNLNPFMRFDGYYLMSDAFKIENLQSRSFAIAQWRLRKLLFGLDLPPPEPLPPSLRRYLTIYAWCVWIYRFFLFIGIALLVYAFFFKVLGIILFLVEILWFILIPIGREVKRWWQMRSLIVKTSRTKVTLGLTVLLIISGSIPWASHIQVPVVLEAGESTQLFLPTNGQLIERSMEIGQKVSKGDILLRFEAPAIEAERLKIAEQLDVLNRRLDRSAVSQADLEALRILLREQAGIEQKLKGLDAVQEKLLVKAPLDGVVVDVADSLHPGRWINDEVALAYLVTENERDLTGYVEEQELKRIILDSPGVFYPENPEHGTVEVKLTELASSGQRQLREPYFASRLGGPIAVRQDRSGKDIPTTAIYRVRFEMPNGLPDYAGYQQAIRGSVRLEVQKASFFSRFVETAASVLIREAGI